VVRWVPRSPRVGGAAIRRRVLVLGLYPRQVVGGSCPPCRSCDCPHGVVFPLVASFLSAGRDLSSGCWGDVALARWRQRGAWPRWWGRFAAPGVPTQRPTVGKPVTTTGSPTRLAPAVGKPATTTGCPTRLAPAVGTPVTTTGCPTRLAPASRTAATCVAGRRDASRSLRWAIATAERGPVMTRCGEVCRRTGSLWPCLGRRAGPGPSTPRIRRHTPPTHRHTSPTVRTDRRPLPSERTTPNAIRHAVPKPWHTPNDRAPRTAHHQIYCAPPELLRTARTTAGHSAQPCGPPRTAGAARRLARFRPRRGVGAVCRGGPCRGRGCGRRSRPSRSGGRVRGLRL
jgi:hypothetical protein